MATAQSQLRDTPAPAASFYGWKLLGVLWVILFVNLGFPAYGSSVINAAMALQLGFDRQTLGSMFSVYMAMTGLPAPLVAVSINRLGVRRTLIIGTLFLITGAVLMATVVTSGMVASLVFGVLVGFGVCAGGALATQTSVARWFVRHRSLALALLYSAGAIGGSCAAPVLNRVIESTNDWRAGWWVLAAMATLVLLVALPLVKEDPSNLNQLPDGTQPTAGADTSATAAIDKPRFVTNDEWTVAQALRTPAYWLMLLAIAGGGAGYTLYLAHGVVHLKDLGHSPSMGAWAVSLLTISGLIAKVIIAAVGDRLDPRYLWALFTALFGVGLAVVVHATTTTHIFIFATCLGIGFGGGIVCLMATLSNYFGTRVFASLSGVALAFNTTVAAVGPIVAGRLYDQGYGYSGTFYFLAAWCFIGATVLFLMKRPRPR